MSLALEVFKVICQKIKHVTFKTTESCRHITGITSAHGGSLVDIRVSLHTIHQLITKLYFLKITDTIYQLYLITAFCSFFFSSLLPSDLWANLDFMLEGAVWVPIHADWSELVQLLLWSSNSQGQLFSLSQRTIHLMFYLSSDVWWCVSLSPGRIVRFWSNTRIR